MDSGVKIQLLKTNEFEPDSLKFSIPHEGISTLASLLPIGLTIFFGGLCPSLSIWRSYTMKFSLIAIAACCAVTGSAFALNDNPGTSPPQFAQVDNPGTSPPQFV